MKQVTQQIIKIATILILILAITTLALARDKKEKAKPGPYVFTTKASAQTVKALIVQESLRDGYAVDTDTDSDHELQFRFSRPAQMPLYGQLFMASNACPGMTTKQVWSYTLAESNGVTKVTVQPAWDFPDDYCKVQTNPVPWSKPEEMVAFQSMLDKAPVAAVLPAATKSAAVAAAVAPAPVPTAMAAAMQSQPATHSTIQPQVVAQDDAARRTPQQQAQQHQACLDLAKDNPSIVCK
jgi:hypothetical protein